MQKQYCIELLCLHILSEFRERISFAKLPKCMYGVATTWKGILQGPCTILDKATS